MKIRLNSIYGGPAGVIQPGQEVDMPDEAAAPLVEGGYAVDLTPADEAPAKKSAKKSAA
jgi:hypothetical protein